MEKQKERKKEFSSIVPFIESVKMIPPVQTNNDKAILIAIVVVFLSCKKETLTVYTRI
jgi:hypothetical protein